MNKIELSIKLQQLNKQLMESRENAVVIVEEMEGSIEEYLEHNPGDVDMLIKLALVVYDSPLWDDPKSIVCLEKALLYDPGNAIATLILAYIYAHFSYLNKQVFNKLCIVLSDDKEVMSMVAYAKGWYYTYIEDNASYERTLLESVALCNQHVRNLEDLGLCYVAQGKKTEGLLLLRHAIRNIKNVFKKNDYYEIYDSNNFLDHRIKGIEVTDIGLEMIQENIDAAQR